ncbi:Cell division topological specificity factor [Raoultella planticola]|uniref:Cell division topological specificity factor n=1 Tax=Raoultella planticola TaxID=575 RepID=A0A485AUU2_RAOPL|nr:Cell division topological specificity factor [Raoultella planticola]
MALLDFFLSRKKNTANIAKERLQIIVAERRRGDAEPHYLPQLRKDILEVICKYVQIDRKWSAFSWNNGMAIFRFWS